MSEPDLRIHRLARPTAEELEMLATQDHEVFGDTGLRAFDLGLMTRAGVVLLAHLGDDLVGSCQLMRTADAPEVMWMVGFYIRPEWRSRGLGKRFLAAVISRLPALGSTGLMLTVDGANAAAWALYTSFGFSWLEEVPEFYGRGEDRYLMRLDLSRLEDGE